MKNSRENDREYFLQTGDKSKSHPIAPYIAKRYVEERRNRTPRSGDLAGVSVRVNLDREYAKSDLTIDRSLVRGALTHGMAAAAPVEQAID